MRSANTAVIDHHQLMFLADHPMLLMRDIQIGFQDQLFYETCSFYNPL